MARIDFQPNDQLTYYTPDIHGFLPDASLIGNVLTHTKEGNPQYVITGFQWMGATDEWGFKHTALFEFGGVEFVRPLSHLCGNRHNGEPRFQESDDYASYEVTD